MLAFDGIPRVLATGAAHDHIGSIGRVDEHGVGRALLADPLEHCAFLRRNRRRFRIHGEHRKHDRVFRDQKETHTDDECRAHVA